MLQTSIEIYIMNSPSQRDSENNSIHQWRIIHRLHVDVDK